MKDIQLVQNVVNVMTMAYLTILDLKYKKISAIAVWIYIILGILTFLIFDNNLNRVMNLLPGIMMILLSVITDEKIGYGDGLTVMGLGIWLDSNKFSVAIMAGMLGIFIFSMIWIIYYRIIKKKNSADKKVAMIPFIFIGTLIGVIYA